MSSKSEEIQRHKGASANDGKKIHVVKQESLTYHQGPIPAPEELVKYESLCPGLADRIVRMAESQMAHRQGLEQKAVATNAELAKVGIYSAVVISLAVIGSGTYIVSCGQSAEGLVAIICSLCSLVGVFIYGKESNKRELRERCKIMDSVSRQKND